MRTSFTTLCKVTQQMNWLAAITGYVTSLKVFVASLSFEYQPRRPSLSHGTRVIVRFCLG